MRTTTIALLALALAGCGGKSSDLEGIYTVDTWLQNQTACDEATATDVAATRAPMFYVKVDSFFGQDFLNVVECTDLADCQAMAGDDDTLHLGRFLLDQGNDDDGWTGTVTYSSGPDLSNVCSGGVSTATLTADGTGVQIREESIDVPSFAPRNDECEPDDAEAAAAGLPCTELEAIRGTFTAEL
jgi:hypothetical protein